MDVHQGAVIESFLSKYPVKYYKKGQTILLADEIPKNAYYLISGRVKQYDITGQGVEITVNTFKPGSYFLALTTLSIQKIAIIFPPKQT